MVNRSHHKCALLGGGIYARTAHLPAIAKIADFDLVAVWSRSKKSSAATIQEASKLGFSQSLAEYNDEDPDSNLDTLLARENVQTVILALPIPNQPEIIERAWRAGKNVISEKPVAKDVALAKKLIRLYEDEYQPRGIQWIVAEDVPYEPGYVEARKIVASGALGQLRSFSMDWFHWMPPDHPCNLTEWRKHPDYQGGYILDIGVHNAAALRFILSAYKDTKMTAVSSTTALHHAHLWPLDTMQALVQTSQRVSGNFNLTVAQEQRSFPSFTFRGSDAILTLRMSFNAGKMCWTVETSNNSGKGLVKLDFPSSGVECELRAFAEALIAGPQSPEAEEVIKKSGPRAVLEDILFIESALRSGETGQWQVLR